ncbi:MAG: metallophosphoesterase [Elusimicrobia bacterium]|nr:metallophosphoesterase [Elusimicrobiota bacterium]
MAKDHRNWYHSVMRNSKCATRGHYMIGAAVLILAWTLASGVNAQPAESQEAVLVGAGDVASCKDSHDEATAALIDAIPGTVFVAGDVAYPGGGSSDIAKCYGPSWGRHKARTRPAVGNHEYSVSGAASYFKYFGESAGERGKGYYSYNMGAWHIVVLNSNCSKVGGCGTFSAQGIWLRKDLEKPEHKTRCTLAIWHHPLFTSAKGTAVSEDEDEAGDLSDGHRESPEMRDFWQILYEHGAEIVVNGHNHFYERFAPQTAAQKLDPERGIREFIVGTGGKNLIIESKKKRDNPFPNVRKNSEVRNPDTYGVIKFTLKPDSYAWQFVPAEGKTFADSGEAACH